MKKINLLIDISPIQKVVLSFIFLILMGTIFLLLPFSTRSGITFVDALFTSTSAVCVTGLTVVDTAKEFTFIGQVIIVLLIQLGGLGIMTFSIALLSLMGGNFSMKWRFTFESFYNDIKKLPIKSILKRIIIYTFYIELCSALILFTQFYQDFDLWPAIWHSIFHAVSAFCNAGFSTFSDNITPYRNNSVVVLTISMTIILGGLGFIVLTEIVRMKFKNITRFMKQFSQHTKIVFITTGILLFSGTLIFLVLEWDFILYNFSFKEKLLTAFFHSVSCRTAGFNSIDIGQLRESTLSMMIVLMFIGGSPGSIAGGVKTTTIAVIFGLLYAKFKGRNQVLFWNRAIGNDIIDKSTTLLILSLIFVYTSTFFLLAFHAFDYNHTFTQALFEVTSAFGTVGLSTGITAEIPDIGKLLVSFVMLVGRLGPLTLITALTSDNKDISIEYAEENIMIG